MGQTLMVTIPCSISLFVEPEHFKIIILMLNNKYDHSHIQMLIILVVYRCACIEHEKNLIKPQTTECKYTKPDAHTQSYLSALQL